MRNCDGCTLCCTLLNIPELQKPAGINCANCSGAGCRIYQERPEICRRFSCMWASNDSFGARDYWKPSVCGIVAYIPKGSPALVFVCEGENWRQEPWREDILLAAKWARGLEPPHRTLIRVGGEVFEVQNNCP